MRLLSFIRNSFLINISPCEETNYNAEEYLEHRRATQAYIIYPNAYFSLPRR